uniref:Uncharacterized protein n=1 Tax=Ciona intestinalis TaxID=7719 RepID=H2XYU3_CIOIN
MDNQRQSTPIFIANFGLLELVVLEDVPSVAFVVTVGSVAPKHNM